MISSIKMKELLLGIDLYNIEFKNYYSVFERENDHNEKYWVISNETDCTICKTLSVGKNLTEFEWENNEIFISNSRDIKQVINLSLKMFMSLKNILETNYSYQKFDLILYISEEHDNTAPHAQIHFYAVRDNFRIIDLKDIESSKLEAILIDTVNT